MKARTLGLFLTQPGIFLQIYTFFLSFSFSEGHKFLQNINYLTKTMSSFQCWRHHSAKIRIVRSRAKRVVGWEWKFFDKLVLHSLHFTAFTHAFLKLIGRLSLVASCLNGIITRDPHHGTKIIFKNTMKWYQYYKRCFFFFVIF